MKKYFLIACWLIALGYAQAQTNPYLQGSFQISGRTYLCSNPARIVFIFPSTNTISSSNSSNYADNSIQPLCRLAELNETVMKNHVDAIFSPQRKQELQGNNLSIGVYLNRSTGVVKEIYFVIDTDSKITPLELYQLENQVRSVMYSQAGYEICPEIEVDYVHGRWGLRFE